MQKVLAQILRVGTKVVSDLHYITDADVNHHEALGRLEKGGKGGSGGKAQAQAAAPKEASASAEKGKKRTAEEANSNPNPSPTTTPNKKARTDGAFKCAHCDRVFGSEKGLNQHLKDKHKDAGAVAGAAPLQGAVEEDEDE